MSVVTFDWPRIETGTPMGSLAVNHAAVPRQAVFRSALESYIADYKASSPPWSRSDVACSASSGSLFLARLARL